MKNFFRILASSLLLLALLIPILTGCGEVAKSDETTAASTDPVAATTAEVAETTIALDDYGREVVDDDVPATLKYENKTLKILARLDTSGAKRWTLDFYAEQETGATMNDAVYQRNQTVADRLGITYEVIEKDGSYDVFDSQYAPIIMNAYNANTHDFDVVGTYSLYGANFATKGCFYNVNKLQYINLDKVWWNGSLSEELTIDNKLYFLVGDMNLTTISRAICLFFNKNQAETRLSGVDLYQEVTDGKWTVDRLTELTANLWTDANGNGNADEGDFFGILTALPSEALDGLGVAMQVKLIDKNDQGQWAVVADTEHILNAVSKTVKLYFAGNNSTYFSTLAKSQEQFAADNGMFMMITLDKATESYLTSMSNPYGVLPLPKYDEEQEAYYTVPQDAFNLISVMANTEEAEMISAALELMCAESYREVTPKYFEIVLKYRYMSDSESGQMLDLIRSGICMDFGTLNTLGLGDPGRWFRNLIYNNKGSSDSTAASNLKGNMKLFSKQLKTFIEAYEALPD